MSTPRPRPDGTPAKPPPTTSSIPASNSLLDLLAGAPARITSPPSSTTASSKPAQSYFSPSRSSSTSTVTANTQSSPSTSSRAPSAAMSAQQPIASQDVSSLMQKFMGPSSPLVVLSPNSKSASNGNPMELSSSNKETSQQQPAIQNKALQLPPSPPSSVSSAAGNKLSASGIQSSTPSTPPTKSNEFSTDTSKSLPAAPSTSTAPAVASPSVKTPFDFVSPFDMLSRDEPKSQSNPPPAQAAPSTSAATASASASSHQPPPHFNGYEAADAGISSLLQKLNASAAARKPSQRSASVSFQDPKPAASSAVPASPSTESNVPVAQQQQPSQEASIGSDREEEEDKPSASDSSFSARPAFRRLPSQPAVLDVPDKQHHASRHTAVLKQDDAFDEPKSSGLSILSPSRSSSAPSIATLDLAAKQPGGLSSLRYTKVEISGVALIPSPFHFPCNVSAAGLLPASRVANLGRDVACYSMSKGKIRLIHVGTGARLLVQTPNKAGIRSIAAFESDENGGTYLLAALTERSKESPDEGVVFWSIPASFVQEGKEDPNSVLLGRITADMNKSPFLYRFTAIAWHPTEPKIAISTSDSNVMVVDVAQQLLYLDEPSSPSKKLRSLSESEVDPNHKDIAYNDPLSSFAFSPDGSLMATISSPLEGDVSWVLGLKTLDGSAFASEEDSTFLIKSPLQESMIISHLSFITGSSADGKDKGSQSDASTVRGVLVGFKCNTILGLYDIGSRSWKHVWKFETPSHASVGDKEHFNLVHLDTHSNTLLVCNSFRSSIFAVQLEFRPLPVLANASLPMRLEKGLLPWSIQPSYPIREYALQDPCTSVSISAGTDDEPSRLFVAFPEGVSIVQLRYEPPAEEPSESETASQAPDASATKPEPASAPETTFPPASVESSATHTKSSKKKNKKKKAAVAKAQTEESSVQGDDAPQEASELTDPVNKIRELQPDVTAPTASEPVQEAKPEAAISAPGATSPAQPTTATQEAKPEPASAPVHQTIVEKPLSIAPEKINEALSDTVAAAVHDAVSANLETSFQRSIESAIPKEVERLISSTELKAELNRNIAQSILPAVQRTAMEVVSRVLAPHFEDVMMQVSDRVERTIVSEITSVRKTLIAEQNESLRDTDKTVQAVQSQVNEVLKQLKDMAVEQAQARSQSDSKIVEIKDDEAARSLVQAAVKVSIASGPGSGDESEKEAALTPKPRDVSSHAVPAAAKDAGKFVPNGTQSITEVAKPQLSSKCQLPERVAVIGAGPVGCLAALAFAQRGCKVDIFESRLDPRTSEAIARASQRSINLALSTRGLTGLRSVSLVGLGKYASSGKDLADIVLEESVPMRARMIHIVTKRASGDQKAQVREQSQMYSNKGECINSVDRGRLNNILLDHALMHPNVAVHFEHKLQTIDFDHDTREAGRRAALSPANGAKKAIRNQNGTGGESSADESSRRAKKPDRRSANGNANGNQQLVKASSSPADRVKLDFDVHSNNQRIPKTTTTHLASFVVGCDGAHSSIRSAMGSLIRMHYTHNYIDTGYVELSIPARTSLTSGSRARGHGGSDGRPGGHDAFQLDPNHLHIWPRHSFMLIALPNLDGSFTCTLFAPFKMFTTELSTRDGIVAFFTEHFPDALPLIGEDKLVDCLTNRRASALGSVQCDPYNYKDRAVLIGDAAHAMLPFYGQGLNCGFEDVRVMFDIIDGSSTLEEALDKYTAERHPDLVSILQLAEQNYREMAHSVVSWPYLLRKKLDGLLMAILPSSMWSSLYAMTTFSNLPYSQVIETEQRQQRIIGNALITTIVGLMTGAAVGAYRTRGVWQPITKGWIEGLQKKA